MAIQISKVETGPLGQQRSQLKNVVLAQGLGGMRALQELVQGHLFLGAVVSIDERVDPFALENIAHNGFRLRNQVRRYLEPVIVEPCRQAERH